MNSTETCPICKEDFKSETSNICHTSCGHKFHTECLIQIKGRDCPLCRDTLIENDTKQHELFFATSVESETLSLFKYLFSLKLLYSNKFSNFSEKAKTSLDKLIELAGTINYEEYIELADPIIIANKKKKLTPILVKIKEKMEIILGKNEKYILQNYDSEFFPTYIISFLNDEKYTFPEFRNYMDHLINIFENNKYDKVKNLNNNNNSLFLVFFNWIKLICKKLESSHNNQSPNNTQCSS